MVAQRAALAAKAAAEVEANRKSRRSPFRPGNPGNDLEDESAAASSNQQESPRSGSAAGSKRGSEPGSKRGSEPAVSRRGSDKASSHGGTERRRDGSGDDLNDALTEAAAAGFFSLFAFAWKLLRESDGSIGRKTCVLFALLLDVLWQADILLPVEALCGTFYLVAIPWYVAFFGGDVSCLVDTAPDCSIEAARVRDNATFFIASYLFDTIFLCCSLIRIKRVLPNRSQGWQAPNEEAYGCSFTSAKKMMRPMLQLIIMAPWDAVLWSSPLRVQWVPFMRMIRLPIAFNKIDAMLSRAERSLNISFTATRSVRILGFSLGVTHIFACYFSFGANQATIAQHFRSSPWLRGVNVSDPSATGSAYLRSAYWGFITMTTVGHVDVMDEDSERLPAEDWELWGSIVVVVLATFVYIYLTANFTSMTMRSYQQLEKYRTHVANIESYLQRHHVRPTLRRLVRQHVKQQFELDGRDDEAILRELPRSMRRELMIDINMRTLRIASLFVGSSNAMISLVCSMLTRISFLCEELIHKQGDVRYPPC